jgi:hypothetical protein
MRKNKPSDLFSTRYVEMTIVIEKGQVPIQGRGEIDALDPLPPTEAAGRFIKLCHPIGKGGGTVINLRFVHARSHEAEHQDGFLPSSHSGGFP